MKLRMSGNLLPSLEMCSQSISKLLKVVPEPPKAWRYQRLWKMARISETENKAYQNKGKCQNHQEQKSHLPTKESDCDPGTMSLEKTTGQDITMVTASQYF